MNTKYLKKITILSLAGAVIILGSCKKFLEQKPITEVGADMVFTDAQTTLKALSGVYSRLMGDNGYGIRLSLYYPLDNDEMQGPTGDADNDRRDINRFNASPTNAQLEKPFNQLFQGIDYANICIDNIPKMAKYADSKQLQRMHGEALTLRAQFYFEAIRNWGDLPAHFQPAYAIAMGNPFPARTDRDSLYERLLSDLKTAEGLVPWRNEVTTIGDQLDERITKGVVKGLRARIALFRGGFSLRQDGTMKRGSDYLKYYTIARDECNDVITSGQHTLNPSFKALWKGQVGAHAVNDPNGELMFQASAYGGTGAEDSKLGYYNGPTVNAKGNKSVNILPTYFYLFDSTDLRRDVTCAPYTVDANGTSKTGVAITAMVDGKYRRDWISNPVIDPNNAIQYFGLKWQILRYSDVLLMFAEAENEINGPANAYEALNKVRRRGYGKTVATPDATVDLTGLSKPDFFKAVVRERALELGGEGVRKYDLIRWNLLGTAINETKANLLKMSTLTPMANPTYMANLPLYCISNTLPTSMFAIKSSSDDNNIGGLWANSFYTTQPSSTPAGTTKITWLGAAINTSSLARYATNFVTGKSELLPIPQPARDANVKLTQNPLYQ